MTVGYPPLQWSSSSYRAMAAQDLSVYGYIRKNSKK